MNQLKSPEKEQKSASMQTLLMEYARLNEREKEAVKELILKGDVEEAKKSIKKRIQENAAEKFTLSEKTLNSLVDLKFKEIQKESQQRLLKSVPVTKEIEIDEIIIRAEEKKPVTKEIKKEASHIDLIKILLPDKNVGADVKQYKKVVGMLQKKVGAKEDGVFGPETLSKTIEYLRKNGTHEEVVQFQKFLNTALQDDKVKIKIDGKYGQETAAAAKKYVEKLEREDFSRAVEEIIESMITETKRLSKKFDESFEYLRNSTEIDKTAIPAGKANLSTGKKEETPEDLQKQKKEQDKSKKEKKE